MDIERKWFKLNRTLKTKRRRLRDGLAWSAESFVKWVVRTIWRLS
jgi:hypothetical protein